MLTIDRQPEFPAAYSELHAASAEMTARVLRHPFLVGCSAGTVKLAQLQEFLIQHGKYSKYFTRCLCALISQLDDGHDVVRLAENLTEELGCTADASPSTPHARLYADMLQDFDIDIDAHPVNPETQSLIDTMFMLCRQPHGTAGLGAMCLGAEALVPSVYARVLEGFQHCGIDRERLSFFSLHIDCDDDHAATMLSILARQADETPPSRITALSAGEIAVGARLRFFDALMRGAPS